MQRTASPSAAEVDRALTEVFERPEFAPPPPSPIGEWLAGVWETVRSWLADLFGRLDLTPGGQRVLFWMVVALLIVAALALLLRLAGDAGAVWRGRNRSGRPGPRPAQTSVAEDWDARAGEAASQGRWRDAALALYQTLLLRLAARGAVRFDAAKTPGDYRREARRDRAAARTLDSFLRLFEPVAFGRRPLDAEGYARLRQTVTAVSGDG